jgi:predicted dehydrogenase
MSKLRVAFIGHGGIAEKHHRALSSFDDVEIVGVAGRTMESAEKFAEPRGLHSYDDVDRMLDETKPDAVFVLVPPNAHGTYERALIDRGIPFFVEKPLSNDWETAKQIGRRVEKSGVTTSVGYHWEYLDTYEAAQPYLDGRKVVWIEGHWETKRPSERWSQRRVFGGQLIEQMTHQIHTARRLAGEAKTVSGREARVPSASPNPALDAPEVSTSTIEFENGALASIHGNIVMPKSHRVGMEITLDDGTVLEMTQRNLTVTQGDETKHVVKDADPARAIEREDRAFIDGVLGDPSGIKCDYQDALATHRIGVQADRSARRRGRVLSASMRNQRP